MVERKGNARVLELGKTVRQNCQARSHEDHCHNNQEISTYVFSGALEEPLGEWIMGTNLTVPRFTVYTNTAPE